MNQGWQCPRCLTIWAPSVARCNTCAPHTVSIPTVQIISKECLCGTTALCPLHPAYKMSVTANPNNQTLWIGAGGTISAGSPDNVASGSVTMLRSDVPYTLTR